MLNTLKIAEAVGELDDKYIEAHFAYREKLAASRAAKAETSSPRRFKLKYALAAAAAAAAVAVSAFAVANIAKTPSVPAPSEESNAAVSAFTIPDNAVLPPTRYGETTGNAMIEDHDFKELYEMSDIVALVRIGDWLSENPVNPVSGTRYDAELLRIYKGEADEGQRIRLKQEGNSRTTFPCYPLFTYGDEMLLFMIYGSDDGSEYFYWLPCSYTVTIDAALIDGEYYFADRFGRLSAGYEKSAGSVYEKPGDSLVNAFINSLNDKAVASLIESAHSSEFYQATGVDPFILSEAEIISLFANFGKE
ncbi:MAG: hypothetical protein J5925_03585 [Clostridia bacterium]|nr:hypothetical protein [Clostridia bacterium]